MRRPQAWLRKTRPMRVWYSSRITGHSAGVDGPSGSYSSHCGGNRRTRAELIGRAVIGYRNLRKRVAK